MAVELMDDLDLTDLVNISCADLEDLLDDPPRPYWHLLFWFIWL